MHHAMHHAMHPNPNPPPTPNQVRLTSWLDGREDISAAMILMPYIAAFVLVLVLLGPSNPDP